MQIYSELALVHHIIRDFVGVSLDWIRVDSNLTFISLKDFIDEYIPEMIVKLELYQEPFTNIRSI